MNGILPDLKKGLAYLLSFLLVLATIPGWEAWAQTAPPEIPSTSASTNTAPTYTGQGVPLTSAELDSLISPIALYPDALVAQILSAATFPDQVALADNWLQQNKSLTGSALMQAANKQTWDPSVKALTQFPTVLNNMAQNLSWTSQLGDAYHNQHAEVMTAVQTLRKQAQAAGNLKTTPQQTVKTQTQNGEQVIVIQPSNPQVVYIPSYNPTVIYGTPYTAPGYSTGALVATGLLSFGAGIAVGAMMSGGCCGWGWSSWNCNWYGGGVYYHGGAYYGNPAWHGGYYGGYGNHYGDYNNYGNHYGDYNNHYGNTSYNNYAHNTSYSHNNTVKNTNVNFNNNHAASSFSGDANGWGSHSSGDFGGSHSSGAFGGWGSHSGGGGGGGWGSQMSSARGWASRGGGGGWGGGGFRGGGGGFRR